MAINSMNRSLDAMDAFGVFAGAAGRARSRAMTRWPWPQPANSVLAVFDDRDGALGLLTDLRAAGIETSEVWTVSGEAGAREIKDAAARRGPLAQLRGLLDGDDELVMQLAAWCVRGATIALMPPSQAPATDLVAAATQHGARFLRQTGLWVNRTEAESVRPGMGHLA